MAFGSARPAPADAPPRLSRERLPAALLAQSRTWGRVLATAGGLAAFVGACQLGVAYGLGLIRLGREFPGDGLWSAQLTWVAWGAALAVVGGAFGGDWFARRAELPTTLGARALLAVAAGIGGAVVVWLTALPARAAVLTGREAASAPLEASLAALLGIVAGILAAVLVLTVRLAALSVGLLVGAVWLLALVSVAPSLPAGAALPEVRLGVLDLPAFGGARSVIAVLSPPVLALAVCGVVAFAARSRGLPPLPTAAATAAAPGLLALAYLIGSPGTEQRSVQTSPYAGALIAIAAGLLGSLLVGIVRLPSAGNPPESFPGEPATLPYPGGPPPSDSSTEEFPAVPVEGGPLPPDEHRSGRVGPLADRASGPGDRAGTGSMAGPASWPPLSTPSWSASAPSVPNPQSRVPPSTPPAAASPGADRPAAPGTGSEPSGAAAEPPTYPSGGDSPRDPGQPAASRPGQPVTPPASWPPPASDAPPPASSGSRGRTPPDRTPAGDPGWSRSAPRVEPPDWAQAPPPFDPPVPRSRPAAAGEPAPPYEQPYEQPHERPAPRYESRYAGSAGSADLDAGLDAGLDERRPSTPPAGPGAPRPVDGLGAAGVASGIAGAGVASGAADDPPADPGGGKRRGWLSRRRKQPAPEAPAPEPSTPEPSAPQLSAPELSTPEPSAPQLSAPELSTSEPSAPQPSDPGEPVPDEPRGGRGRRGLLRRDRRGGTDEPAAPSPPEQEPEPAASAADAATPAATAAPDPSGATTAADGSTTATADGTGRRGRKGEDEHIDWISSLAGKDEEAEADTSSRVRRRLRREP